MSSPPAEVARGIGPHVMPVLQRVALAAVSIIAFLALCQGASAGVLVATTPNYVFDGPYIGGPQVAWQDSRCYIICQSLPDVEDETAQTVDALRVTRPGRRAIRLFGRLGGGDTGGPSGGSRSYSFAISATRLAWLRDARIYDEFEGDSGNSTLRAGRVGGHLPLVYRCGFGEQGPAQEPNIALDEDVLAYQPNPCTASTARVAVRDLKSGATQEMAAQPAGEKIRLLRVAGRYLAVSHYGQTAKGLKPPEVTVYDHRTRVVAYEAKPPPGRSIAGMDVQEDGTLFVETDAEDGRPGCSKSGLGWYSLDAVFHPLPGHPCRDPIRAGGGRVVYRTPTSLKQVTSRGITTTVASFGRVQAAGFDADTHRSVVAVKRCDQGFDIVSIGIGDAAYRAGSARCPVALRIPTRLRAVRGAVRLSVSCPRRCLGRFAVFANHKQLATRLLRIKRGGRVRLRLTRSARSLLSHRGTMPVAVRAVTLDRDGRRRKTERLTILSR